MFKITLYVNLKINSLIFSWKPHQRQNSEEFPFMGFDFALRKCPFCYPESSNQEHITAAFIKDDCAKTVNAFGGCCPSNH